MKVFLYALGEKVWQAVEVGWIKPKETPVDWDEATNKAANFNSRALDALFSGVANEKFKKIWSAEVAKEAWTILETTYEGTKAIKTVKFQRLTSSFEEIRMEEEKTFDEFYTKLKDIVTLENLEQNPKLLGKSLGPYLKDSMPRSLPFKK